jgi:carboxyl-terminal processing protease
MRDTVPDQPPEAIPQTSPVSPPAPARGASPLAWVVAVSLAAVVGALLFIGGYLAGSGGSSAGCSAPTDSFAALCEAYDRLKAEYVDDLDDGKLAEGAIRGMFQYGVEDPYSGYMPPEEYQQALGDLSGKFSGIGAEMAIKNLSDPGNLEDCPEFSDNCVFVVVAPLAGSPAEAAGLEAGDIVTAVDGQSVNGSTMQDEINRVRGEPDTQVTLTIRRGDGEPFDVTITRAEITLQEVETRMISGHIGYISLNGFSDASTQQFADGLRRLLDEGADQVIFDLRDNPGGYIEAARRIAGQFIESGVVFTQESSGDEVKEWVAEGDGAATDPGIELVVLVNGGSASASEIVAAALQEHDRATVIGQPTFGKDTVQVWSRLENDGGVRITISRWFTPDHGSVAPDGVQPDIAVEVPPETPPEQDLFVERAVEFLGSRGVGEPEVTPRPSGTPSALPLTPTTVGFEPAALRRGVV